MEIKNLTEDEFYEQFTPEENHLDDNASFDGCMFETYGDELDYVVEKAKENKVWTIIEGEPETECEYEAKGEECPYADGGSAEAHDHYVKCHCNTMFYVTGLHLVNRIGFLVTEEAYTEEMEVKLED